MWSPRVTRLRLTPGVELRTFWGSEAAKTDGSYNLAGISHPAIDALIVKVMEAKRLAGGPKDTLVRISGPIVRS